MERANIFIRKKKKKEIKLHNNTYVSPFMLKLKQNCTCSYTHPHTHTTLYMWMHRTPSRISSINCKVAKVFSQKLGIWKMLNKWWLLFPCAAKFWEPIGIAPCGTWTLISDLCRRQCSAERRKFANLLNNPVKTLSIHLKTH